VRRSAAWDTCSATPASPPPTNTPSSRSTPSSAPAATGVFVETASGARTDRPTLTQLLDQLRPGDTLVVWKLDRLGRSLRHLVDTVTNLADQGVGFCSLQEAIDTTTPGGKLVFHVFAALAEFERDLIRERTAAGLAAARVRGRRGGRPWVLTGHKLQVALEMYASGQYTVSAIAATLGSAGPPSTATWIAPAADQLAARLRWPTATWNDQSCAPSVL
jgi:DNA invertase Pin-like site-specific DNA recombinase